MGIRDEMLNWNPRREGISQLLHELQNHWGPLDLPRQQAVVDYVTGPTEDGWSQIARFIVVPGQRRSTIWQWVRAMDPSFPDRSVTRADGSTGWDRIPEPLLLVRALKAASDENEGRVAAVLERGGTVHRLPRRH